MDQRLTLLEPCVDKEEAIAKADRLALTIVRLGYPKEYGVKVMNRRGWGVWLIKRV